MSAKELAKTAYQALKEKKGNEITVIDISGISILADYFIIASGSNENHVHALADSVQEEMQKKGAVLKHMEGYQNANWILLDFQDVIVHVQSEEDRLFYDLERIWRDGRVISPEEWQV